MTISNMWGSFVGPWGGGTLATATNFGMVFTPTVDGAITKVGFRRRGSGSAYLPNALQVWRVNDQTKLWETITPTDSGALIWQMTTVAGGVAVQANVAYVVTMYLESGKETVSVGSGSVPAYGANLQKPALFRRYVQGGGSVFPINNDAAEGIGVDIEFDSEGVGAPDDTPVSGIDLENALASWLDVDDAPAARPGSLAVVIYDYLQTMQGVINEVQGKVDTAEDVITGILGPTGSLFTGLLQDYLDNLDTLIEQTLDAVDELRGVDNRSLTQIYDAVAAIPTTGGGTSLPYDLPGGDYTETDLTTATGSFVWVQPADLYWLHVEDMAESARTIRSVGGENIYWFRGWAKPWDGLLTYPDHIEFSGNDAVIMSDRRWPGVMVWLPPDVEVTIKSFDYTP